MLSHTPSTIASRPASVGKFILALALVLRADALDAASFTLQEMNFGILNNSLGMTTSMLLQTFGSSPAVLNYFGTFSDVNWTAALVGNYAGLDVDLVMNGTFNDASQQGSYLSTGTVGPATWQGTGTWSFAPPSASSVEVNWDAETTILIPGADPFKPDRKGNGPWTRQRLDGSTDIQDFGTYSWSFFGLPVPFFEFLMLESDWVVPNNPPGSAFASVILPRDDIALNGVADFGVVEGTTTGTVAVIPEPSTLLLLSIGVLATLRKGKRLSARYISMSPNCPAPPATAQHTESTQAE
jgi:hypothetical protein